MKFLWYAWFLFIAIFLIWQHFSKMWPLKGAVSSSWAYDFLGRVPLLLLIFRYSENAYIYFTVFIFFNEEISQKGGQKETHKHFLSLTLVLLSIWSRYSLQLPVLPGLYMQSPAMVCLHTSPSKHPALPRPLETQDLWREAMGPQKAQVVTPQPWKWCNLCGIRSLPTAIRRGVEGRDLSSQNRASGDNGCSLSCLALQNSEKWIGTSALAVMWRWKWLSRLGCITPDKNFSSQPLTLSICVREGNSLLVDRVDILLKRLSKLRKLEKQTFTFFFIWLSCLSEAF